MTALTHPDLAALTVEDRVRALLTFSPRLFTTAEVASELGISLGAAASALRELHRRGYVAAQKRWRARSSRCIHGLPEVTCGFCT